MPGPLDGVRVLELTSVVLGPWACQILGDLGADVVQVEPPAGDSNRQLGPARHPGMAALYLTCNRNKRSLVLDLKQPAGKGALLKLAEKADVLVHNYRPAALTRLSLDYPAIRAKNPRVVFCGTYGYAKNGPYRDRAAYDDSIQSASGIAMLPARMGEEPRSLPRSWPTTRPRCRSCMRSPRRYTTASAPARARRSRCRCSRRWSPG